MPTARSNADGVDRRRRRGAGRRAHRIRFFVDDTELALLQDVAQRAGMAVGAWVATAATTVATSVLTRAPSARAAAPSSSSGSSGSLASSTPVVGGAAATAPAQDPMASPELAQRLLEARAEVHEAWRQLRIVGGLLNQVAAVGNATGELPANTDAVLDLVSRATARVDATAVRLRDLAAGAHTRLRLAAVTSPGRGAGQR